jgi:hypothetical protein
MKVNPLYMERVLLPEEVIREFIRDEESVEAIKMPSLTPKLVNRPTTQGVYSQVQRQREVM